MILYLKCRARKQMIEYASTVIKYDKRILKDYNNYNALIGILYFENFICNHFVIDIIYIKECKFLCLTHSF